MFYDLKACLEYNEVGFTFESIAGVHAVVEGEHDESD